VLDNGAVVQQGPVEQLKKEPGLFRQMQTIESGGGIEV